VILLSILKLLHNSKIIIALAPLAFNYPKFAPIYNKTDPKVHTFKSKFSPIFDENTNAIILHYNLKTNYKKPNKNKK